MVLPVYNYHPSKFTFRVIPYKKNLTQTCGSTHETLNIVESFFQDSTEKMLKEKEKKRKAKEGKFNFQSFYAERVS